MRGTSQNGLTSRGAIANSSASWVLSGVSGARNELYGVSKVQRAVKCVVVTQLAIAVARHGSGSGNRHCVHTP